MFRLSVLKKHIYVLIPIVVFLLVKILTSGIYISDSGNYFYVAFQMLHGNLLYRDIFFADLPLMPLISVLYFLLTFGNLWLFNFTVVIEIIAIALIIYYLAYKKTHELAVSWLSAALFLFSGFIFLTSVSQTFIFTASLFLMIGYLFFEKKKPVLAGIFFALSFTTKAYFIPLIAALFIASLIKYKFKFTLKLGISFLIVTAIVLLPFVILSGNAIWADIITFSLFGRRVFPILDLFIFFVTHEPILSVFFIVSIIFFKRDYVTALLNICFLMLFFFYQSLKPLYLVMIIPFLCLSLANIYLYKEFKTEIRQQLIIILVILSLIYTFWFFGIQSANQARVSKIDSIVYQVIQQQPDFVYGTDGIAPSIAYLSHVPLLDNQIDTDDSLFTRRILNSKEMTRKAINSKTIFIALGYLDDNGDMRTINSMFDLSSILNARCTLLDDYAIDGGLQVNRLFVFKCY